MTKDIAASIRARLLNLAKEEQTDFEQMLVRYTLERLLYRLSQSAFAERFVLKGALLFSVWYGMPHRSTRDADLLGFGPSDLESIRQTFKEIAGFNFNDGVYFDTDTINVDAIRKDAGYTGARVLLSSNISHALCKTQIDIGDVITPGPESATYPVLFKEFPAPTLRTYPVYTVIAEKLHAINSLGMSNSRLKDYLDIWMLLNRESPDSMILAEAIAATFTRRGMVVPTSWPVGLLDEFAQDSSRNILWARFLTKNQLTMTPLTAVINEIRSTLGPAFKQAATIFGSTPQH